MGPVKRVSFSFLTAGPTFELDLPNEFEDLPEIMAPASNGIGGREFVFLPTGHDTNVPAEYPVVSSVVSQDARTVQVYQWPYDPPQWYLRWSLAQGDLWTHLREEDGLERAEIVAGALTIRETVSTPFLLLSPPLRSAVGPYTGFQEEALYLAPLLPSASVALRRPSFVNAGVTVTTTGIDPDLTLLRAGSDLGLEVQCIGTDPAQLKRTLAQVLQGLSEAAAA